MLNKECKKKLRNQKKASRKKKFKSSVIRKT